ncbi:type 2 periplasmic-binding domain-containing protein [Parenemella sanctibonifatiensis]|uniref:Extracellular solute-binding protein n=1 Tax=Parenemella sanctibonifatiensis TaxID=2016505 RepID=A0A255EN02_9ACTN|nr:hypothetical protein [Parenemella sanctibonifatiensis]OYN89493.1 hypothetical protein CGZ91_11445 [Parenemella sanctibonifatiensis]
MTVNLSRRSVLAGAAGVAAAATLAACSNDNGAGGGGGGNQGGGGSNTEGLEMPTRVPFDKVTPDVPGDDDLQIPDGYYNFPPPVKFLTEPLPAIEPINYLAQGNPPGVAFDRNQRYAAINEQLNTTVNFTFGGSGNDYTSRFQVMLASGDLPDLVMMASVPQMPQVLDRLFTDLTPYLSGDNIAQFPGLAAQPSNSWKIPTVNGKIWGVPMPRPSAANIITVRTDEFEARGVPNWEISNGDDLFDMFKELSRPAEGKFAVGGDPAAWLLPQIAQMMGAPNVWSLDGDKFVSVYETEEYAAAIEKTKEFWDADTCHPNSFTEPTNNAPWFKGGVNATYIQGFAGWSYYVQNNPFPMDVIRMKGWDGGDYNSWMSIAAYGAYIGIPKTEETRLQELLGVLNAMASPFGTEEMLVNYYGVEGVHYEFDDNGNPINNQLATDEYIAAFTYMGVPYSAHLYTPGEADLTDTQADYLKEVQPLAVENPADGLYSEAAATDGAAAQRDLLDAIREIIQGRRDMSTWENAVSDYMSAAGNKAAEQLAAAYQEANA